jgi:hypothetical protein
MFTYSSNSLFYTLTYTGDKRAAVNPVAPTLSQNVFSLVFTDFNDLSVEDFILFTPAFGKL